MGSSAFILCQVFIFPISFSEEFTCTYTRKPVRAEAQARTLFAFIPMTFLPACPWSVCPAAASALQAPSRDSRAAPAPRRWHRKKMVFSCCVHRHHWKRDGSWNKYNQAIPCISRAGFEVVTVTSGHGRMWPGHPEQQGKRDPPVWVAGDCATNIKCAPRLHTYK